MQQLFLGVQDFYPRTRVQGDIGSIQVTQPVGEEEKETSLEELMEKDKTKNMMTNMKRKTRVKISQNQKLIQVLEDVLSRFMSSFEEVVRAGVLSYAPGSESEHVSRVSPSIDWLCVGWCLVVGGVLFPVVRFFLFPDQSVRSSYQPMTS